jgi:site-specific recombinase XerD
VGFGIDKDYSQYTLRHTWITSMLKLGVDSHTVAKLAGHANTRMIDKVYSHIADDSAYMLKQAKRRNQSG